MEFGSVGTRRVTLAFVNLRLLIALQALRLCACASGATEVECDHNPTEDDPTEHMSKC
jgi:hypothetical protein